RGDPKTRFLSQGIGAASWLGHMEKCMASNTKQMFALIVLVAIVTMGMTLLVRNTNLDTPAGRMKQLASQLTPRGERELWQPTPERQALVDEAARTTPDPLSDELVPVLAALPKQHRDLVFFGKTESDFYLAARSWALRDGYVTGDRREVDMFLDILRE